MSDCNLGVCGCVRKMQQLSRGLSRLLSDITDLVLESSSHQKLAEYRTQTCQMECESANGKGFLD